MLPSTGIQTSENPFIGKFRLLVLHVGCLAAFFVQPTPALLSLMLVSWFVRTFGWEGGLHRYFAHRSYKTSRAFQLVLACLGAASGQRGPLWWAAYHRAHHRYADTARDPHAPRNKGRFYAYVGWLHDKRNCDTDLDAVRDLSRYPELVWVNKYHYLFPYLSMVGIYALGQWTDLFGRHAGLAAVVWGFFIATWLSLQGSLLINAFAHGPRPGWLGYRNFSTPDTSHNLWPISLLSLGSSWHNNHHRYMNCARAGIRWWELDLTYLTLKLLAALGLVWDLREVPEQEREEEVERKRFGEV